MPELRIIPYELINPPPFPMREKFDDAPFQELVESIRANGIENPLKVRPVGDRFDVVAGHRRYVASGVCALRELPCIVDECDELAAVAKMIAENTGREDVTATEQGRFYFELMDRFKLDMPGLARLVRKSEAHCDERMSFVSLDNDIAEAELNRLLTYTAARELLRVNPHTAALVLRVPVDTVTPEQVAKIDAHRKFLLDLCVRCGATARVARSYVEQWKTSLAPMNPFQQADQSEPGTPAPAAPLPRCAVCGRDGDPQNMRPLLIHYYELDKVKQVLREAGFVVYE